MFQINCPCCYASPPKFGHYDDVMPIFTIIASFQYAILIVTYVSIMH